MTEKTKAVNLTQDELSYVLGMYGARLSQQNFTDVDLERINYLNKRLKSFNQVEITAETDHETDHENNQQQAKSIWPIT